jgi:hypothetical protein
MGKMLECVLERMSYAHVEVRCETLRMTCYPIKMICEGVRITYQVVRMTRWVV